jgi:hypothetical protein
VVPARRPGGEDVVALAAVNGARENLEEARELVEV